MALSRVNCGMRGKMPAGRRYSVEQLECRQLLAGWLPTGIPSPGNVPLGPMLQLTDGTIMVQQAGQTNQWFRHTPDLSGSYINGSWSNLANMNVSRIYFSSDILS